MFLSKESYAFNLFLFYFVYSQLIKLLFHMYLLTNYVHTHLKLKIIKDLTLFDSFPFSFTIHIYFSFTIHFHPLSFNFTHKCSSKQQQSFIHFQLIINKFYHVILILIFIHFMFNMFLSVTIFFYFFIHLIKFKISFQYLMTKTAAMHFGQGRDLHGHQAGAGGGAGSGSANGREVKPHQCQQCLKAFSSNHQVNF